MCGRFARFSSVQKFADLFGTGAGFNLNPRYNVAPTQALLARPKRPGGQPRARVCALGLDPALVEGAKTPYSTFNTR